MPPLAAGEGLAVVLPICPHGAFAQMEHARQNLNAAERLYRKCIALDPMELAGYWELSHVLEKKKDVAGAIKLMKQFVRRGGLPGEDGKSRLEYLRGL